MSIDVTQLVPEFRDKLNGLLAACNGNGAEMLPESRERWTFPDGPGWREIGQRAATTSPHMTPAEV